MITKLLTLALLISVTLLWLLAAAYLALGIPTEMLSLARLSGFAVLIGAVGLTCWAIWHLRASTAEQASARVMLAIVNGFCLFIWAGWMIGWGGGI